MKHKWTLWPIYVAAFYFLPLLFASGYVAWMIPIQQSWPFFMTTLAIASFGSVLAISWGYFVQEELGYRPKNKQVSFPLGDDILKGYQEKINELDMALEEEQEQRRSLETVLEKQKTLFQEQAKEKNEHLGGIQGTIDRLQKENEKKERYAVQLENRIRDLSYEIKTLLQLANIDEEEREEIPYATARATTTTQETTASYAGTQCEEPALAVIYKKPLHMTHHQASLLLQRCIDMAQKMTGSQYLGYRGSRMGEYGSQAYTLDLRHLFERLRMEGGGILIVYSRQEGKVLYVSEEVRDWLGWNAEKFAQNFPFLVQEGYEGWERALSSISQTKEVSVELILKTKNGDDTTVRCQLSLIPTGLFKGYLLGVLY